MGSITKLLDSSIKFVKSEQKLRKVSTKKNRDRLLVDATATLRDVAGTGNVSDMLDAEQLCINHRWCPTTGAIRQKKGLTISKS